MRRGAIALVLILLAGLVIAAYAHEPPCPFPPPPERQIWERVEWPFGMTEVDARNLQRLDSLLSDIEKARSRVPKPRMVLPGPVDHLPRMTINEFEVELVRILRKIEPPPRRVPLGPSPETIVMRAP